MERTINTIIGRNIRHKRKFHRLSQMELAARLGVTYQQVQKYENGINGISPAKLLVLSNLFGCPFESFFLPVPVHETLQ